MTVLQEVHEIMYTKPLVHCLMVTISVTIKWLLNYSHYY